MDGTSRATGTQMNRSIHRALLRPNRDLKNFALTDTTAKLGISTMEQTRLPHFEAFFASPAKTPEYLFDKVRDPPKYVANSCVLQELGPTSKTNARSCETLGRTKSSHVYRPYWPEPGAQ